MDKPMDDQQVLTFRLEVIESARRANEKHHYVEDPEEFEHFVAVAEQLGEVLQKAVKKGASPEIVGRTMLYYAKAVARAFVKEGMASGS